MAKARDRTEDFKDAVRQSARSLGYDEVYIMLHHPQLILFLTSYSLLWFLIIQIMIFPLEKSPVILAIKNI
jgi:hypothetical protein